MNFRGGEFGNFPPLGTSAFDMSWISQGLTQAVLNKRIPGPVYDATNGGSITGIDFEDLLEKAKGSGGDPINISVEDDGSTSYMVLVRPDGGVWINITDDTYVSYRICTTNKMFLDSFQAMMAPYLAPFTSRGKAFVMVQGRDKPTLKSIGLAASALERGNYNYDVLEAYDHVVKDLQSKDPTGRLTILDGPPGGGKTYAIRGFMHDVPEALFIFVPVSLVPHLANPGMIGTLIDAKKGLEGSAMIFIVEDADTTLAKRGSDNLESISALLNLGDGILGSMLDIRVVCTTNLKDAEMDEAVIRPGRLNRKIHISTLDREVAEGVYFRLTGNKTRLHDKLTLAQIYSMAKDKGWVAPVKPKRSVGFSSSELTDVMTSLMDDDD